MYEEAELTEIYNSVREESAGGKGKEPLEPAMDAFINARTCRYLLCIRKLVWIYFGGRTMSQTMSKSACCCGRVNFYWDTQLPNTWSAVPTFQLAALVAPSTSLTFAAKAVIQPRSSILPLPTLITVPKSCCVLD